MKTYRSHKVVQAAPILHVDIADLEVIIDNGGDADTIKVPSTFFSRFVPVAGDYLVRYEDGYLSASPKKAFDDGYVPVVDDGVSTEGLSFGVAIALLKGGKKVAREGWNGKGMFLFLVPGSRFKVNRPPLLGIYEEGTEVDYHAHIDMKTAQGYVVPWLASQADMLAEDWRIVD